MKMTMTMNANETNATIKMMEKIALAMNEEFDPKQYVCNETANTPAAMYIQKLNEDGSMEFAIDVNPEFTLDFLDVSTDIAIKGIGVCKQIAVFLKALNVDLKNTFKASAKRLSKWRVEKNDPESDAYKIIYRAAKDFRYMECGRGADGYIAVVSDKKNPECYLVVEGKNYQRLEKEVDSATRAMFGDESTRAIVHYFSYAAGSNRIKNISRTEIKGYESK